MDTEPKKTDVSSAQKLAPIPTPPGTQWREFRIKFVPFVIFAITLYAVFAIWRQIPLNTGIKGIGEGTMSQLTAPADGYMANVTVGAYGEVNAGQPLATIVPFDPAARLGLLQSQLQVSRLEMEPSIGDRNAMNYEQLQVDLRQLNSELAIARANLQWATNQIPRYEQLSKEKLVSQDQLELVQRSVGIYEAEVQEKSKARAELLAQLQRLQSIAQIGMTNSVSGQLIPQFREQISAIETNFNPIPVLSPIKGRVHYLRQTGEFVRAGDPIAVVNVDKADRIIAYLKQPFPFDPQVGMKMEIITRSKNPQRFITEISAVGGRVEILTNSIAFLNPGSLVDMGLPVVLPVPAAAKVRPGEIVDVMWHEEPATEQRRAKLQ